MKTMLLRMAAMSAAWLLILTLPLAAQQSSVEGMVLNRATGQPIAGVHARFALGINSQIVTRAYGALTGADGRFTMTGLPGDRWGRIHSS